ncbi:MAG: photosystem reaction center subunit H [Stappia sp.]|uniref:PRC-barrel domain-containing protein n=1 Tax=Stappia sp. TaxID=1870903 RepID=UPI000C68034A|nr:PRC-barrel domain-containing protein [Stappia sp.]MAB00159.1 photosystem reaction center subunit H [Stappia sp.]MBM20798.1 photosystem reaction center subunit H [Stappia sp.]|tara:strand:+ start:877 stop:1824 length:948 start_codon:yes stop_codon:yes gene_type:complete
MIRTLLTTTALAAALTTGAIAADDMKSTDATRSNGSGSAVFNTMQDSDPMQSQGGYFAASPGQILASSLIGQSLYNGSGEDAESVGDVNDVVLSQDGKARAVVVGVGGFLGIGEKDVAVDFTRVNWVERDGSRWLTVDATQEELENAPAFDRTNLQPGENTAAMEGVSEKDTTAMVTDQASKAGDELSEMGDSMSETASDVASKMGMDGEPETMTRAADASADELIGSSVYNARDEEIGEVDDVILAADGAKVEAVILDVGGVLGINEKPVELKMASLDIKKDSDGEVHVYSDYSEQDLEAMPEYNGSSSSSTTQ